MSKAPRFPRLQESEMTEAQRELYNTIASGPRGGVRGPFLPLMHHPDLAMQLQRIGELLRYRAKSPNVLIEFGILMTARKWSCQFEWFAHAPLARKAGLSDDIIEAIADSRRPSRLSDEEAVAYDVCEEVNRSGRLSDATFDRATKVFGHDGVLELISVCGYYSLLAFVLNVADDPLPDGASPPLR